MNFKTTKILMILGLVAGIIAVTPLKAQAQTIIKIGEAELVIQSPLSVKKSEDTLRVDDIWQEERASRSGAVHKRFRPRFSNTMYVGVSLATPIDRDMDLPIHYGASYNFEVGIRNIYRISGFYGIGTMVSYSYYNYKLKGRSFEDIFAITQTNIKGEYFRTDNISLGFYNRFYITGTKRPRIRLDVGAYGDLAYSRRYKVKGKDEDGRFKEKFRDGSIFNPFQAGLYGALVFGDWSVFGKYRFTNQFNPNPDLSLFETPRLNIGMRWDL